MYCIIRDPYDYPDTNISTCFVFAGAYKPSIRKRPQSSLSQVCSSWRAIALRTPQLWDNICIVNLTEASLSTAREYLSRARNLPISITIRQCTTGQSGLDWRSQLTDFLSSSYRIRTLDLGVSSGFHHVLPDLPQLESLLIHSHPSQEKVQIDLNDTRYPKLAIVRIGGAYKISSFNSRSLRIFDGTKLSMTVIESWDLLTCCPSLEESRLNITQVNGSRRPVSMPQIHLQRLRILYVRSESDISFSTFIEVLTLPVVEQLHVVHAWSATAFQSLAHRSNYFSRLRDFVLRTSTSVVDAGALLASIPRITNISLPDLDFNHLALNGLARGSLAPRLQTLTAGYISNTGSFLDMVESRMENAQMSSNGVPAPFTKVVFDADDEARYSDRLREMQQRGIPIKAES
ncbi:hypothetical protein JOM56_015220 [Amanita muscaria]